MKGNNKWKTIKIPEEVHNRLVELKDKLGVDSIYRVVEYLVENFSTSSTSGGIGGKEFHQVERLVEQLISKVENLVEMVRYIYDRVRGSYYEVEEVVNEGIIEDIVAFAENEVSDKKNLYDCIEAIRKACIELGIKKISVKAFEKAVRKLYKGRQKFSLYDINHPKLIIEGDVVKIEE